MRLIAFDYKTFTLYGSTFQKIRLTINFVTHRHNSRFCLTGPTTPNIQRPHPITYIRFRLFRFRSPLLTESLRFIFIGLLRCFSSPTYLRITIYSLYGDTALPVPGLPIRKLPDHKMLAPPRYLSQLATPFVGSLPQGIHHTPFIT